jgi:hypothetical protein
VFPMDLTTKSILVFSMDLVTNIIFV